MKKKIGIVFGGRSGEHEISVRSAQTVVEKINKEKFEVIPIAIDQEGKWLNPSESVKLFPEKTRNLLQENAEKFPKNKISLIGDTEYNGLTLMTNVGSNPSIPLDLVFPVLHGTYGEDGTIQGLFEMANIPYVGCGVLASSCGMDKVVMKTLFRDANLPMCNYVWFLRKEWEQNKEAVAKTVEKKLGFPNFVKPANLGSSVGVSQANNLDELQKAIEIAAEYDRKIIIEEGLDMREIECAVIGNDEPLASLPGEYIIKADDKKFLDYKEKYQGTGNNEFVVPALISKELTQKIQNLAINAFKSVDGAGLARVDFFLRNDTGELLINELNTLPGLTSASGFPKMWEGSGKSFTEVIDLLVDFAFERFDDKAKNKTTF